MSLKAKIEAIIYAAEEPVTLAQLVTLLGAEAQQELDEMDARQPELPITEGEEGQGAAESEPTAETLTEPEAVAAEVGETGQNADTPSNSEAVAAQEAPEAATEEAAEPAEDVAADPATDAVTVTEAPVSPEQPTDPEASAPEAAAAPAAPEEPLFVDEKKKERRLREYLRGQIAELMTAYEDRGVQITEVASGYRMSTKPEYHDVIRGFAKSLKPALKLSLPALETLAVIAYKQPVTAAEVSDIRGVDSAGVLGGLMTRKLITTAGRKQVIGRPILYKTTKEFLLRFGLKDTSELPSIEEFEKMAGELAEQEDLAMEPNFNTDVVPGEPGTPGDSGTPGGGPELTPNPDVTPMPEGGDAPATPEPEPQADGSGDSADSVEGTAVPETPGNDVVPGTDEQGAGDTDERAEREAAAGIE